MNQQPETLNIDENVKILVIKDLCRTKSIAEASRKLCTSPNTVKRLVGRYGIERDYRSGKWVAGGNRLNNQ